MELTELLKRAVAMGGSDIFIVPGAGVTVKINETMQSLSEGRMAPADTEALVRGMYDMARRDFAQLEKKGDDDFSFAILDVSRFRCNAYKQRGTIAAICRIVNFELPNPGQMHIPPVVMELAKLRSGMVLVTGPAGSGKSTTLACLVDQINATHSAHIVTIEDPIEYLHRHKNRWAASARCPTTRPPFPARCAPPCARRPTW